ncbi:MAG: putative response regulator [Gemmatimonadetes bacterium]|nr:putative response regulator [Gemmatimonadota bacterium]
MVNQVKSVLWVDDEAESLEPHRMFLRDKGFHVESVTNAEDAVELVRRRSFDLVLLDEQMPGKRGLDALADLRDIDPHLPIVMVTKSEEDETLTEALGAATAGYLVKPVTPRQVYAIVARLLEGPAIRRQVVSQRFVERFRALQNEDWRSLDWRGWIERYAEIVQWDVDLGDEAETGLQESLRGLLPDLRREFAHHIQREYAGWVGDLSSDRPPLSIDIVQEFLLPVVEEKKAAVFVVVDCLRLDQWRAIEPLLAEVADVETTHYYSLLPTATPFARNALFSGLFPAELASRYPEWWREREDESLNAHERELLEAQLATLGRKIPVRYEKISTATEADDLQRRLGSAILPEGISAFVFNFIDLLTHGRSESAILYEVARDEVALRQLTLQWFRHSALFALLREAARRGITVLLTSDHGSIHCNTPATVFAKRDATMSLRFKFGEDLRAEQPAQALLFRHEEDLKLPKRGSGANTLLAVGDCFFVYPTKLREYQGRYRGSFLHGGVSPEECILPLSLLSPRR